MALDPANYIEDLDATQPPASDPASQADDHMRAIKKAIKQTFPNGFSSAMSITDELLNGFEGRIAALEALGLPTMKSPKMGRLTVPTGAGNTAVTGVGYEPSLIVCVVNIPDTGEMNLSMGFAPQTTYSGGVCSWSGTSFTSNTASSGFQNQLWSVSQWNGSSWAVKTVGQLLSLDADGFTLDNGFADVTAEMIWIVFP